MSNHFNDLLLQTLKEINVRLDRLEGRTDRLIDEKVDKTDLDATNARLDGLREDMRSQGQRLDRIEAGIGTLKWIIGAEVAIIGVIFTFVKAC